MIEDKYSTIRPYNDNEALEAFQRLAINPLLRPIADYLFPDRPLEQIETLIKSIKSVDQFQSEVMLYAINRVVEESIGTLSHSGIEGLTDQRPRLLLSNHRDIILDSAIIQVLLHINNLKTSEMAVGDNLITDPFIEDVARSNKMIKVLRKGNPKEIYLSSKLLSNYIRDVITNRGSSVWLAQRNGRTKNGLDETENALLKMLDMSGNSSFVENFNEIAITPVAISYQYEPCDYLKARELFHTRRGPYVKAEGEDINSIITGVKEWKGDVHIHFSEALTLQQIENSAEGDKNEKIKKLADVVDRTIRSSYKLWNTNYIAHDLLNNSQEYNNHYSAQERDKFIQYYKKKLSHFKGDSGELEELEEIFLSIYSAPIDGANF